MITIYTLMKKGNVQDEFGDDYPDVLTTNLNNFKFNNNPVYYPMNSKDVQRIDLLMNNAYRNPYYDDIVLWLNNIYKNDINIGDIVVLPNPDDVANFVKSNKKRGR